MARDVDRQFETSVALTLLGEMIDRPAVEAIPAVTKAWDSAWIA
ncbi:MAG: hypothetical protein ACRYGP_02200 [Janthinobacterium lividum]